MANMLYNSVELPNIDRVWINKETLPYAFICKDGDSVYTLILSANSYQWSSNTVCRVTGYESYIVSDGLWTLNTEYSETAETYLVYGTLGLDVIWSNIDILEYGSDTEIYLETVTPVIASSEKRVMLFETTLQSIANAIRTKNGETIAYLPSEMPDAIQAIGVNEDGTADVTLVDLTVSPTGERFTKTAPEGQAYQTITVKGDSDLTPENLLYGVSIYGVDSDNLPMLSTPIIYDKLIRKAIEKYYDGDFVDVMVMVWDGETDAVIAVVFLTSDFEILTYNESTTEFTAIGWYSCFWTESTDEWSTADYRTVASTGGNYMKHVKYATRFIMYNSTTLFPVAVNSDVVSYVTGTPINFILSASGWNGTTYSLSLGSYTTTSEDIKLAIPATSSMYNADIVTKCALSIPKVDSSTADDGVTTYTATISAVTAPTVDVQIAIWGLST